MTNLPRNVVASVLARLRNVARRIGVARTHFNEWRAARNKPLLPVRKEPYVDHLHPIVLSAMNTGLRNTVRELLDHADTAMVLRYAHLSPDHLADAVEKVARPKEGQAAGVINGKCGRDTQDSRWLASPENRV